MVNQIESLKNLNQDQKRILLNVIINIQKKLHKKLNFLNVYILGYYQPK